MDVIISGQITAILPVQQGVSQRTGQPWVSQEYVLCHEPGQYPKSVCFRVFGQDKIQQMNIQMGEQLSVHLNISCQQSQRGGYFNSIDCWKVERAGQQQVQQPQYQQQPVQPQAPLPQQSQTPQYQQPAPGAAPFPPQVNAQGQPMQPQQQGVPGQGQLPF